jgi:pilus assembly protein CpaF
LAGAGSLLATWELLRCEVTGAGPLQQLVEDPDVSDVLVNGPGPVWVDRGRGVELSGVRIDDESSLRRLAQRITASVGRRLDDACPCADVVLPDGTRVHAVLPPVAMQGTTLSLRVPPRRTFRLDDLVQRRTLPSAGADLLRRIVERRLSFVVSGGTGTGKTTLLSSLLSLVPPGERIVMVEDAAELRPTHPHVVRLQTRHANAEGAGIIAMSALVREALRMRPDRIVVGEVRGAEVVDLLNALNTGHEGGAATIHTNRIEHLPARFEALCALAGLPRDAAHAQLAAGVQVVVHLRRCADGRRQVAAVAVVAADTSGLVHARPAYAFDGDGMTSLAAACELDRLLVAQA